MHATKNLSQIYAEFAITNLNLQPIFFLDATPLPRKNTLIAIMGLPNISTMPYAKISTSKHAQNGMLTNHQKYFCLVMLKSSTTPSSTQIGHMSLTDLISLSEISETRNATLLMSLAQMISMLAKKNRKKYLSIVDFVWNWAVCGIVTVLLSL